MQGPQAAAGDPGGQNGFWWRGSKVLARGQLSPSTSPIAIWVRAASSPSGVRGKASAQIDFYAPLCLKIVTDGDSSH